MRGSLGALLAIGFAGLQFVAVLVVVFSSYLTSERVLLNHARSLLNDVGSNTIEHSKGFLYPARDAAELAARLAQNQIVASDNPDLLEQLLFQQLQITPQFSGLFYGSENGGFVYVMRSDGPGPFRSKMISMDGPSRSVELIWRNNDFGVIETKLDPADPYDPRTRPWYISARKELTTIWTAPYIFFSSQQPGITLAAPVRNPDGTIRGVIGVDIEIDQISGFLARQKIGNTGKALIINQNGDVIAHPNLDLIKTQNDDGTLRFASIWELDDPIARAAFGSFGKDPAPTESQRNFSEFTYDGDRYVATLLPAISDELPWTIAVYAPESDFTGSIKQNRATNIWIAAFVAVLTGLVGLALANFIHRPVKAFAVRSALISQGEIDPSAPLPRTYQELAHANETLVQQIVARKKSEREYGQTFDLSSRGMAQIDAETGKFRRVNQSFCETTGYAPEELATMGCADLTHPEDSSLFSDAPMNWQDEFATNREVRFLRKDGETISVSVNAILIRDHSGLPMHAVVTLDDITESKAKESQITQLNRELSRLARGNTMGQMAEGLAHELNQPLTAVAQNAGTALVMVERGSANSEDLKVILTEIEQQSLRAGDIIRALRSFISKDEKSKSAFNFAELLEQTQRLVQAEATEAGVRIESQLDALPLVQGNRIQIAQVIVNLIRNAIEALAASDTTERRVTLVATTTDDAVLVSVADTGTGVDPGIDLFSQFETTKATGMGLGLSICRSMIEANGGKLWLDKTSSQGARFCFTLPIHQPAR